MSPAAADRNLLLGILALQLDFLSRDALIAAMHAWVLDKAKPLGQILVEHGGLSTDRRALLEGLVSEHLKAHGDDLQHSLAALSSLGSARQALHGIADADVQASLAAVRSGLVDPERTTEHRPTEPALRYRILRPHAKGGLGEVFVAEDAELHRHVALKEIQARHAHDPASRGRFVLEAEITGGLEHPGIVPVYGLGTYADGRPFYAMRFVKGDSLKTAIERFHQEDPSAREPSARRLQFRELLRRFMDVCNAVAYAHSRGVLHRDLKPGNVMLGQYGETLLVDWGLAKVVGRPECAAGEEETPLRPASSSSLVETVAGVALGTPAYMSPEQAAGKLSELGPASDVYSLGATLYALLTGRPPFDGHDPEVLQKVGQGRYPRPRQVHSTTPAALEAVCLKAMARQPTERYATPQALAADIEHWLADEPVTAYAEPWPVRAGRWFRQHPKLLASAATLLVSAVVGVALLAAASNAYGRMLKGMYLDLEKAERELGIWNQQLEARNAELSRAISREKAAKLRARQALDAMSSDVIETWLGQSQRLTPEQKDFLRKALAWYEEFVHEAGESPEERAGLARAQGRVGLIRSRLGEHRESETAYRDALALQKQLTTDFPTVPAYRLDLAKIHSNLGVLFSATGRRKEAETACRDALALRKQLAADFPTVAEYRQTLAVSHSNLGNLLSATGRPKEAETAYADALVLQKQLAADFPTVPVYRQDLARSHSNLGILLIGTGRKGAEKTFRDALVLQKQLAAEVPTEPAYREELAVTHNNLGLLLSATDRPKEAEAAHRAALVLQKQLAADFPAMPVYRQELAVSHYNLGNLLSATDRPKEAESVHRDALAIRKELATNFPTVTAYCRDLASSYNGLGNLLSASRPKEAETAYRDALAVQKQLAADFPTMPDLQNDVANTFVNLAGLQGNAKRYPEARALLEQARPYHEAALRNNPRNPLYRQVYRNNRGVLANIGIALGDHGAAAAAADQFLAVSFDPQDDAYNAACFLSQCVGLAGKDTKLPDLRRKELAQSYGDRALKALRQALAAGYKDVVHMKKDTDLDALRGRADFQKLVRELEEKTKAKSQ